MYMCILNHFAYMLWDEFTAALLQRSKYKFMYLLQCPWLPKIGVCVKVTLVCLFLELEKSIMDATDYIIYSTAKLV